MEGGAPNDFEEVLVEPESIGVAELGWAEDTVGEDGHGKWQEHEEQDGRDEWEPWAKRRKWAENDSSGWFPAWTYTPDNVLCFLCTYPYI